MNLSLKLVRKPLWKHILKPVIVLQTVFCVFSSTYLFAVCDRSPSLQGIVTTPGWQRDFCEEVLGQSSLGQIFVWTYLHIFAKVLQLSKYSLRDVSCIPKYRWKNLFKRLCLSLKQIYICYLFILTPGKCSRLLFSSICSSEGDKELLQKHIKLHYFHTVDWSFKSYNETWGAPLENLNNLCIISSAQYFLRSTTKHSTYLCWPPALSMSMKVTTTWRRKKAHV